MILIRFGINTWNNLQKKMKILKNKNNLLCPKIFSNFALNVIVSVVTSKKNRQARTTQQK